MAGSKSTVTGEDFYGPYDAQDYAAEMAPALGMQTVPSLNIVYTEERGYVTADVSKAEGLHELKLSGHINPPFPSPTDNPSRHQISPNAPKRR